MSNRLFTETLPLTEFEKTIVPDVVDILSTYALGHRNSMTNAQLASQLLHRGTTKFILSAAQIRKLINYIRVNNKVSNLLACSTGYFISATTDDQKNYIKSLITRHIAIFNVEQAMAEQANINLLEIYKELGREDLLPIPIRQKLGRDFVKRNGGNIGRRKGSGKTVEQLKKQYESVIVELNRGSSILQTSKICNVSTATISRLKKKLNIKYKVKENANSQRPSQEQ